MASRDVLESVFRSAAFDPELCGESGYIPHTSANLFRLFTEIALAIGILRLYLVDLAEGRAREESLKKRAQQAESLSSATLELSAQSEGIDDR